MGKFFATLKRRHIYAVAAACAVIAWALIELVNNFTPAQNLPGQTGTAEAAQQREAEAVQAATQKPGA